jgi:hypothetical protein
MFLFEEIVAPPLMSAVDIGAIQRRGHSAIGNVEAASQTVADGVR